ncbi:acyltransferase family protein [Hutsoniella sourekii]|uniref:acyltransferase family protein n=1 Tax=Hutsoniella sourekii TaxID=87650 RepID=UPI000480399D|nr:acyltransferase family protein [Hutsoniella sourekii]
MERPFRLSAFDGVKGFAIVAVVFYHMFPDLFSGGFLMVNTFLVLSGYFFAYKMEKDQTLGSSTDWRALVKYIKHTFERLFIPLFWMIMLIVVGLYLVNRQELHYIRSEILSGLTFTNNFFQLLNEKSYFVQMADASPLTHLWYNAIYLQSFLLAVPIVLLTNKLKLNIPAKGLIWLVLASASHLLSLFFYQPGADPSRVYYGLDTRFASFAIGLAGAYMTPTLLNFVRGLSWRRYIYNIWGLFVLIPMLALVFYADNTSAITYLLYMPVFNILSMFLAFLIVIRTPLVTGPFDIKLLAALGKRSYSYYLWYYPVIVFVLSLHRLFNGNQWILSSLMILGLLFIGEIFYHLIEKGQPRIWWGNHLTPIYDLRDAWKTITSLQIFNPKPWLFIAYIGLLVLFVNGMKESADNKRVALFELEYRLYQNQPNLLEKPYPAEAPLVEVKETLKRLDEVMATNFIQEESKIDPVDTMIKQAQLALEGSTGLEHEISQTQEQLQELRDDLAGSYPGVLEALTPQELIFASQVPVTFFGDSLIQLTAPYSLGLFQNGNEYGQNSLQVWDAVPIYQKLIDEGFVKENVVINLGTNASLDLEAVEDLVALSGDREVFFVNTNSRVQHVAEVNQIVKEISDKYDNVHQIDWYSYQQGHPEWYGEDDIHHSMEGMEQFTILVAKELYQTLQVNQ